MKQVDNVIKMCVFSYRDTFTCTYAQ